MIRPKIQTYPVSYAHGTWQRNGKVMMVHVRLDAGGKINLPVGFSYDYTTLRMFTSNDGWVNVNVEVIGWVDSPEFTFDNVVDNAFRHLVDEFKREAGTGKYTISGCVTGTENGIGITKEFEYFVDVKEKVK